MSNRSEPEQRGSNIIQFADHHHRSLPDDRSTSGASLAAAPFTSVGHPFEFGSWAFTILFFAAPSVFVGAAVGFYVLLIA